MARRFTGLWQLPQERGEGAGCLRVIKLRRKTSLDGFSRTLDGGLECTRHTNGVARGGDCGIYKHGIGAHFDRLGGVTRRTDARIDHHGNGSLLDDDFDLSAGFKPPVAAYWHQRHDVAVPTS
jgi:hypothetical protein